jgi:hypothetical protein
MHMPIDPFIERNELDNLAYRFFREFSRMEYALKVVGDLRRNDGSAEACWKVFAQRIHHDLQLRIQNDPQLFEKVNFINAHPPKKQIVVNRELRWIDNVPDGDNESVILIEHVKRVRNNLFHGGKFNGNWLDPERSSQLIDASLVVIVACRNICPRVNEAYGS